MKKNVLLFLSICMFFGYTVSVSAQGVSISAEDNDPHESSLLDIESTEKGFLISRMTTAQRNAISNPAESLLIFNTTTRCFEWWDAETSIWILMSCGDDDKSSGKSYTSESSTCGNQITDVQGNIYNTIKIGNQCWMSENLKTIRYNDNTDIALVEDNVKWNSLTTGAYSRYDKAEYTGFLYNSIAINTGKLCPEGWRVATKDDWKILEKRIGFSPTRVIDDSGFIVRCIKD